MRTHCEPPPIRVLRVCSVFPTDHSAVDDRGLRCDHIVGMENHASQLTARLDERGLSQTVVTARRPAAPKWQRMGTHSEIFRLGVPVPWARQFYAAAAAAATAVGRIATRTDLVHAHLGEDLAVLPLAQMAALRHGLPLVVTIHCSLQHTLRVVDARTAMLKSLGGAIEGAFLPKADAVIVLTERTGASIRPAIRGSVYVIPPGDDIHERLGSGAVARAESYSWDAVADRVMEVYRDVTAPPRVVSFAAFRQPLL